jgi:hypothetical protein
MRRERKGLRAVLLCRSEAMTSKDGPAKSYYLQRCKLARAATHEVKLLPLLRKLLGTRPEFQLLSYAGKSEGSRKMRRER